MLNGLRTPAAEGGAPAADPDAVSASSGFAPAGGGGGFNPDTIGGLAPATDGGVGCEVGHGRIATAGGAVGRDSGAAAAAAAGEPAIAAVLSATGAREDCAPGGLGNGYLVDIWFTSGWFWRPIS